MGRALASPQDHLTPRLEGQRGESRRHSHSLLTPVGSADCSIRSGPEGARGVLKVSGWSFCILLSELSSLKSSEGHLFLKFTSWRSPFSKISSIFLPLEVTFREISGHGLHFSQIYLANYVGHMKMVFLMILSAGCLYVSC